MRLLVAALLLSLVLALLGLGCTDERNEPEARPPRMEEAYETPTDCQRVREAWLGVGEAVNGVKYQRLADALLEIQESFHDGLVGYECDHRLQ
jgi:hypothetical protein